ncbi:P-loop NTPase fold protein [Roseibium sediminicola]|uniref:P-loop NTPase fold protein n=1 Tax=Roseibium sediminicola TaxID=2933272 RepID=A0ABT0H286_9HYPH|nr:P-loop NTPase fold protein [Roseibium sp. CAU 1639]MCK7615800.1 P-loop NTPase fold protein [Roseibium sp. CAU 1639]
MDSNSVTANFAQFKLESHVNRALKAAWSFSGGAPVEAAHVLRGILLTSRRAKSEAFSKLSFLLPVPDIKAPESGSSPSATLEALPLAPDLAQAFSVAEEFFKGEKSIWGRDLVTLALTAPDSPSLLALASEAGVSLQELRAQWMDFVRETDKHRSQDAWEAWWRTSGISAAPATDGPAAYLVLWNPEQYPFSDMDVKIKEIGDTGSTAFTWRTGNRKNMAVGSRLFLFRTGAEPRGLVGVGTTTTPVAEAPHRDPQRAEKGQTSPYVEASWEALSRDPLLGLEEVISRTGTDGIWSSQGGGVEIPADVAARLEAAWRDVTEPDADPKPALPQQRLIASFDADTGDREDTLNIGRYVDAFARVMSSRALKPPLSIGLFGDWGSGKTFFMEKLFDKIETTRKDTSEESRRLYYQNICQIRFNAWHYAETNLWASLVTTIFDELRVFLDGRDDKANEKDEFNKLLNKLEVAEELRAKAQEDLEKAKEAHAAAEVELATAKQTLAGLPPSPELTAEEYQKILGATLSKIGLGSGDDLKKLVTSLACMTGRDDLKASVAELSDEGHATVERARDVLRQTQKMTSRAGFWWRILLAARVQDNKWVLGGGLAVIVLIPILFGVLDLAGKLHTSWAALSAALLEVLAISGVVLAWVRSRLKLAAPVFDRLDAWQTDIEERIAEAKALDQEAYEKDCQKARLQEEQAREQFEAAQQKLALAAQAEDAARRALKDSTSKARLDKFIRDRAASEDYAVHLGLIAMIHRDFRKLSELMELARKDPDSELTKDIPRVDRIILYIDDLDRCHPPERVVRVLEATHLLLFFPLFVVVVGVDSRWVSRALYKHYEDMLADESLQNGAARIDNPESDDAPVAGNALTMRALRRPPAESQDFLEKIFQVPFWLRRMDEAAVKRMVHDLIKGDAVAETDATKGLTTTPKAGSRSGGGASGSADTGQSPSAGARSQSVEKEEVQETTLTAEDQSQPATLTLASATVSLTISAPERQFMEEVAPLMPRTPRSVKRFINIYRLYKSALSPEGLRDFLGTADQPGNFRAVQILLALVTGSPLCARCVFDQLQTIDGTSAEKLSDLVGKLNDGPESWQTTIEALRVLAKGDNDLDLSALRNVSALVSRYSVHHMVAVDPGRTVLG